jgi:hypothetical protein
MARYEDDGIEFAQQQFSRARDYREEQAKKQEKFAKRLQLANLAVSGVNFAINQKANALEANQATKRAAYQNTLTSLDSFKLEDEARLKNKQSVNGYLTNQYYQKIKEDILKINPNAVTAEYSPLAMSKAKELALASEGEYKKLLQVGKTLQFDNFEEFYKTQGNVPRNIGSWLGSKVSNFMKGENKETIKLRNDKAKDALVGTEFHKQFEEADTALLAYHSLYDRGHVALDIANQLTKGQRSQASYQSMKGPQGNGIYLIYTEEDIKGGPPKVNTIYAGGIPDNENAKLEFKKREEFLEKIKPNKQQEVMETFLKDPTGTAVLKLVSSNPDAYYSVNWKDKQIQEELFQLHYDEFKSTAKGKDGSLLFEPKNGTYIEKRGKQSEIIDLGFDVTTYRKEYESQLNNYQTIQNKDISNLGFEDLSTLVSESQRENLQNLLADDKSIFYQMFNNKLSASDASTVDLGEHNLSELFPGMGLTGTRLLRFDRATKTIRFK